MATATLPAAIDIERLILGAAMTDAKALLAMLSSLQPLDFSLRKHQLIFTAMRELHAQGQSVDRVTLAHRLEETGDLRRIDGLSYLVSLDDGLPQLYGLESYIRTVQEAAMRRRLIHAARAIANEAAEGAGTATELLERAEQQLRGIGGKRTDGDFPSASLAALERDCRWRVSAWRISDHRWAAVARQKRCRWCHLPLRREMWATRAAGLAGDGTS